MSFKIGDKVYAHSNYKAEFNGVMGEIVEKKQVYQTESFFGYLGVHFPSIDNEESRGERLFEPKALRLATKLEVVLK